MGLSRPTAARGCIAGLAALGVVLAHRAAYALGTVNVHDRADLAEASGHAYMPYATAAALGLLVAALTRLAASQIRAGSSVGAASSYWRTAFRLAILQTTGFVVLELGERAVMGINPTHLLAESVLAIGIVAQCVIALLGALLLILFSKGVGALAKLIGRFQARRPAAPRPCWNANNIRIRSRVSLGSISLRGPPPIA